MKFATAIYALGASLVLVPPNLQGQNTSFGQNQVRFNSCRENIIHGPRVDIYYCPGEEFVARLALIYSEKSVDTLLNKFRMKALPQRPQIFVFANHYRFEQTRVAGSGIIPEEVGGITEFLEKRIVLPFSGDAAQFEHVMRHELVHYFHFAKIADVCQSAANRNRQSGQSVKSSLPKCPNLNNPLSFARLSRNSSFLPPLWFMEGLAEHWSEGQNARDLMINRDLVYRDQIPTIEQFSEINDYVVYPLGGELMEYLGATYGEEKIPEFYENILTHPNFFENLSAVYGTDLKTISSGFKDYLRRRYYRLYLGALPISLGVTQIATQTRYSFNAVYYEVSDEDRPNQKNDSARTERTSDRGRLLFVTPEDGYTTIYKARVRWRNEPGRLNRQIKVYGQQKILKVDDRAEFESLHFPFSILAVSGDGKKLAFVAKRFDRDALYLWDLEKGKELTHFRFDSLIVLRSPSWDPAGQRIVFSGSGLNGISDLYIVDVKNGLLERLTNDIYLDEEPVWSKDGGKIVFVSNRTSFGERGYKNLFVLDLDSREINYLTYGPWNDEHPRFSADGGKVVFSSDRTIKNDTLPVSNLYLTDLKGNGYRLTYYVGGAFDPVFARDSEIIFTGFEEGRWGLYLVPLADSAEILDSISLPPNLSAHSLWKPLKDNEELLIKDAPITAYQPTFHLMFSQMALDFFAGDYYGSEVAFYGLYLLNDATNDRSVYSWLYTRRFTRRDLRKYNSDATGLMYQDFSGRRPWFAGVYNLNFFVREPWWRPRHILDKKNVGLVFGLQFPSSRFRRIETQFELYHSDMSDFASFTNSEFDLPDRVDFNRRCLCVAGEVAVVNDNALSLETGPISGGRSRYGISLTTDLTRPRKEAITFQIDWRRYLRTGLYSAIAAQVFVHWSEGAIPERIALGGSNLIYGLYGGASALPLYPPEAFYTDRAWKTQAEFRFPLTRGLYIADVAVLGNIALPPIQAAPWIAIGQFGLDGNPMNTVWGSYGLSIRMPILQGISLRFDHGRRFYLGRPPNFDFKRKVTQISFGPNF